jgi:hypothetical protein
MLPVTRAGVATPADFMPHSADYKASFQPESRQQRCFIPGGESLAAIEDCDRREAEWKAALERACTHINKVIGQQVPELLKTLPAGEGVRISATYTYGGSYGKKTQLLVSGSMTGAASIMNAGKRVELLQNNHCRLERYHGGDYKVISRRDTPEGKELAKLVRAIPPRPELADYPVLHADFHFQPGQIEQMVGANGVVPRIWDIAPYRVLVYNSDDSVKSDFCPRGARPISTAVFEWLKSDQGDRNMGITPPPMPDEVRQAIGAMPKLSKKGPSPR